jgi:DNA-binding NtrC family response regulator
MQRPILVVDDDDSVRGFVRRVLEDCGDRVALALHAYQALDILSQVNGAVRLVLTDVRMPGLSGVELLQRVRSRWPEVPCLCMTGYAEEHETLAALMPPCPLLRKPFSMLELETAVNGVLSAPP